MSSNKYKTHQYLQCLVYKIVKPGKKTGFLILSLIVLLPIIYLFSSSTNYQCPSRLFGIYCAGCGGIRMLGAILSLNFYQAFRFNPLLFILLILFLIYAIVAVIEYIRKRVLIVPGGVTLIVLGVLILTFMIARNIPAFSYLIPTYV